MSDREKVINCIKYCINHPLCIDCDACDYGGESSVICDRLIQDTLDLLEEQQQWVSVKDKLPELGKNVLVYIERNAYRYDETFRKREIAIGWQMNGSWHVDGCSGVVGIYWQELPELPKEVKE